MPPLSFPGRGPSRERSGCRPPNFATCTPQVEETRSPSCLVTGSYGPWPTPENLGTDGSIASHPQTPSGARCDNAAGLRFPDSSLGAARNKAGRFNVRALPHLDERERASLPLMACWTELTSPAATQDTGCAVMKPAGSGAAQFLKILFAEATGERVDAPRRPPTVARLSQLRRAGAEGSPGAREIYLVTAKRGSARYQGWPKVAHSERYLNTLYPLTSLT